MKGDAAKRLKEKEREREEERQGGEEREVLGKLLQMELCTCVHRYITLLSGSTNHFNTHIHTYVHTVATCTYVCM